MSTCVLSLPPPSRQRWGLCRNLLPLLLLLGGFVVSSSYRVTPSTCASRPHKTSSRFGGLPPLPAFIFSQHINMLGISAKFLRVIVTWSTKSPAAVHALLIMAEISSTTVLGEKHPHQVLADIHRRLLYGHLRLSGAHVLGLEMYPFRC